MWTCWNCGCEGILDGPFGVKFCPQCHAPREKPEDKPKEERKPATSGGDTTAKTSGGKVTAKGGKAEDAKDND